MAKSCGAPQPGVDRFSYPLTDLMGGQVPMLFTSLGPAVGAVKGGKIRALAVTSLTRSAAFHDVPTMDELGLKGFDSTAWYGLLGPAGLPAEVVSRWTQTLDRIRNDYAKWGRVVREANIRAD